MANLQTLIPYLEQGFTLGSVASSRDTLTPQSRNQITWQKAETRERRFPAKDYTLAEVRALHSIWDWGIVFLDEHKVEHLVTQIQDIEQAIQEKRPHTVYGIEPKWGRAT